MKHLVFLVEELSMQALLDGVLPRVVPEGFDFQVVPHEGKSDLRDSIPRKIRGWGMPGTIFIVLIDQDSFACKRLKKEIVELCKGAGRDDVLVRIVCHSLESWVLGDLAALGTAFSRPRLASRASIAKFRDPDRITDPLKEVRSLVPGYQKVSGARVVGEVLDVQPTVNASKSFNAFVSGLRRIMSVEGN